MTTPSSYAPPPPTPPSMAAATTAGAVLLPLSSAAATTPAHPLLLSFPYLSSNHFPFKALRFLGRHGPRHFLPSPPASAVGCSLVSVTREAPSAPVHAAVDDRFRLPSNIPAVLTMQPDSVAPFLLEDLLTGEEAVVAAAAAEAVALAKAAVNVAKGAASMAGGGLKPSMGTLNDTREAVPTMVNDHWIVGSSNMNEVEGKTGLHPALNDNPVVVDDTYTHLEDVELQNYACSEISLLEMEQPEKVVAVRSVRQLNRKNMKDRALEKTCFNLVSVKGGISSRKKRSSVQEIDYSDPLRYLRNTTSTSKLLTATEELECSEGIQDLLKLEKLYEELEERFGDRPTFAQWASAAGTTQRLLRKRLNHGILCKDKMIKSNVRLVISIAKNYQGAGMNLQDLVQEGCRGLVKGAEKFDASKGFKFSTYAHWWIKQAIRKSLSDQSRTIRLPFHMVEATYRVREATKQIISETGRHPDNKEVAAATGLSMKRLTAVLLTPKAPKSLDQKIGINQNLKASEVIAHPEAETTEDILIKQFMKQDLYKVLDTLNPREKQVVRSRFGLDDGRMRTLQEIGEMMGVSRERVRQIESCAFRKLKNKKRTKLLRQYFIS